MEYAGILAQLAATAHRFLMRLQGPPAQQQVRLRSYVGLQAVSVGSRA